MSDSTVKNSKINIAPRRTRQKRTLLFQVLFFLAMIAFSFLTYQVETSPAFAMDLQITRTIQTIDSPFLEGLMWLISWPGFLPQSVIVTVLIALTLFVYRLRWESVTSLLAATLSGGTNELVKDFIARPRPASDVVDVFEILTSYSFPSGHVMFYTILFGFLWYLAYTSFKQSLFRTFLLALLGGLILFVGVSRVYLGQHWASDVLGAYLLGGLLLAAVITLYQWGKQRFFVQQSVARQNPGTG